MTSNSLLRSSSLYAASDFAERGIGLIMLPVYAHTLDPAEFGLLALVQTTTGLGSALLGLGLYSSLMRYYHNPPVGCEPRHLVGTIWPILFAVALIATSLLALLGEGLFRAIAPSLTFGALVLPALIIILLNVAFIEFALAVMRTREDPIGYAAVTLSRALLTAGLICYFLLARGEGVEAAVRSQVLASTCVAVGCTLWLWRFCRPRWDRRLAGSLLRFGAPLIPQSTSSWALRLQDRLLLDRLGSTSEVGLYAMAYRLASPLQVVLDATQRAILPRLSAASGNPQQLALLRGNLADYVVVAFSLAMVGSIVTPPFVDAALPAAYEASGDVAHLVIAAVLLMNFFRLAKSASVFYSGRTGLTLVLSVVGVVLNAALNIALIPRAGMQGAAVAAVATFGILTLVAWWCSPLAALVGGARTEFMSLIALGTVGMGTMPMILRLLPDVWAIAAGSTLTLTYLVIARGRLRVIHEAPVGVEVVERADGVQPFRGGT